MTNTKTVDQYDVLALAWEDDEDTTDWQAEDYERYAASIGCQLVWSDEEKRDDG